MNNPHTHLIHLIVTSLLLINSSWAAELYFPTTEAEIVQALTAAKFQKKGFGPKGYYDVKQDTPKVGALIHFDFDSATIKPESYPLLREYANAFTGGLAAARIEIGGHTDSEGSEDYNQDLSIRRAQSVKDFLVLSYGITDSRLTIKGYGENLAIDTNTTETGRAKNRRVEFTWIASQ